jgi:hypothetical protein
MKKVLTALVLAVSFLLPPLIHAHPATSTKKVFADHIVYAVSSNYPDYVITIQLSDARDQILGVGMFPVGSAPSLTVTSWNLTTSILDAQRQKFWGYVNVIDNTGSSSNLFLGDFTGTLF